MDRDASQRRLGPWLAALFGVVLSFGAWRLVTAEENRVTRAHLELGSLEREVAIRQDLSEAIGSVGALAAFFSPPASVSSESFREVSTRLLETYPSLRALGWNPRVPGRLRDIHEAAVRREGHPDYQIQERAASGAMVRAKPREDYYAVRYIEPLAGNEAAFGYDVGSEPRRRAALVRAAATGELALTAGITLVQDPVGGTGFLAFEPVYRAGAPTRTPAERQENLVGFVVGVFRLADVIDAALAPFSNREMEIFLTDVSEAGASDPLLLAPVDASAGTSRQATPDHSFEARRAFFEHTALLEPGGRRWRLSVVPTAAELTAHRSWVPLQVMLMGLLITGVVTRYVARLSAAEQRSRREIFQRKQAERALRESEQRLRLTVDAVTDGGWDWNAETRELHLSHSWFRALGYAPDEFEPGARTWRELVHPEDAKGCLRALGRCLEGRADTYDVDVRLRSKSGEYRWFHDRGAIVERTLGGQPLRLVGAQTDITERKLAEEERRGLELQLHDAQKLESLGVLAGGVAHDFNNLLTTILGGADLALLELPADAPARGELEEIKLAAVRAAELTHQMLAYAGKAHPEVERLDVSQCVEEMAHLMASSISKKAELCFAFAADLPAVMGDATQIRQVVMNLLTNASDALEGESGSVVVRTKVRHVDHRTLEHAVLGSELPPGDYVSIEVADTGVGMEPAVRTRIFEPFFTTKFQGRGLGLAAALGIVRRHGGALRVESEVGRGSTLEVLLPCAAATQEERHQESSEAHASWRGHGTVLVVDDEAGLLRFARKALETLGFKVATADNGREALTVFEAHADEIVAVLLDVTMPEMSGVEACHALRRIRPDLRVVLSSGYTEEDALEGCGELRSVRFLHKPYTLAGLGAVLRELLGG